MGLFGVVIPLLIGVVVDRRIDSVSPSVGSTMGNTRIVIKGVGFSTDYRAGGNIVMVGDTECVTVEKSGFGACTVLCSNYNQIVCDTGKRAAASKLSITVKVDGQFAVPANSAATFTYEAEKAGKLLAVHPPAGRSGTVLNLHGKGWDTNLASFHSVLVGSETARVSSEDGGAACDRDDFNYFRPRYMPTAASFDLASAHSTTYLKDQYRCRLPAHEAGSYLTRVTRNYGDVHKFEKLRQRDRNGHEYEFQYYPTVYSVSPRLGATNGGTEVTIVGEGFAAAEGRTHVRIGSSALPCAVVSATATTIVCRTAAQNSTNATAASADEPTLPRQNASLHFGGRGMRKHLYPSVRPSGAAPTWGWAEHRESSVGAETRARISARAATEGLFGVDYLRFDALVPGTKLQVERHLGTGWLKAKGRYSVSFDYRSDGDFALGTGQAVASSSEATVSHFSGQLSPTTALSALPLVAVANTSTFLEVTKLQVLDSDTGAVLLDSSSHYTVVDLDKLAAVHANATSSAAAGYGGYTGAVAADGMEQLRIDEWTPSNGQYNPQTGTYGAVEHGLFVAPSSGAYMFAPVGGGDGIVADLRIGGTGASPQRTVWARNQAMRFEGKTSSYALVNSVARMPRDGFGLEFWVRSTASEDGLVSYRASGRNNEIMVFGQTNLMVCVRNACARTSVSISDGEWHHLSVNWISAGGILQMYKDGDLVFSRSALASGTLLSPGGTLVLGQQQHHGGGFKSRSAFSGDLDEIRLWAFARDLGQVKATFRAMVPPRFLVLLYSGSGSGQDDGANGYHLKTREIGWFVDGPSFANGAPLLLPAAAQLRSGSQCLVVGKSSDPSLVSFGSTPASLPLQACEGDCDSDTHCAGSLKCFQRTALESIPGCVAGGSGDLAGYDYCYDTSVVPGALAFEACSSASTEWLYSPSSRQVYTLDGLCLTAGNPATATRCKGTADQTWLYEQRRGQLALVSVGLCLAVGDLSATAPCTNAGPWSWPVPGLAVLERGESVEIQFAYVVGEDVGGVAVQVEAHNHSTAPVGAMLSPGQISACTAVDSCLYFPGKTSQETCTPSPLCGGSGGASDLVNVADDNEFTVWDSSPWDPNSTLSALVYDTGPEGVVVTRYRLLFSGQRCPSSWTFEGSHDNTTWTVLPFSVHEQDVTAKKSVCNKDWIRMDVMHPPSTQCRWGCPNTVRYRFYRWRFLEPMHTTFVTDVNSSASLEDPLRGVHGYLIHEARLYTASQPEQFHPGIFTTPLRQGLSAEHVRTIERVPQIYIESNNLTAACIGDCGFGFSASTLAVDGVTPRVANKGDVITITGVNFANGTVVDLGGQGCAIMELSATRLRCRLGPIPGGNHTVKLRHPVLGYAQTHPDAVISAALSVTSVTPPSGSLQGGTILTIAGHGFAASGPQNVIRVGSAACIPRVMTNYHCHPHGRIMCHKQSAYGYTSAAERHYAKVFDFSNDQKIECVIAHAEHGESTVGLVVSVGTATASLPNAYSFASAVTPVVSSVFPAVAAPGTQIWLRGSNLIPLQMTDMAYYMDEFGFYERLLNRSVWIDVAGSNPGPTSGFACHIEYDERSQTYTDPTTHGDAVVCTLRGVASGVYDLAMLIYGRGFAAVRVQVTVGLQVGAISRTTGSWHGGNVITVEGLGFSSVPGYNTVTMKGPDANVPCKVFNSSATSLSCVTSHVPLPTSRFGPPLATNVHAAVICANPAFCFSPPLENKSSAGSFSFHPELSPKVLAIHPRSGTHGTVITVVGTNFSAASSSVIVNGVPCALRNATPDANSTETRAWDANAGMMVKHDRMQAVALPGPLCAAGTAIGNGSNACTLCAPGHFKAFVGNSASECRRCPAGAAAAADRRVCTCLQAGHHFNGTACAPPSIFSSYACNAGTFLDTTTGECKRCAPTHFKPFAGNGLCAPCQPGVVHARGGTSCNCSSFHDGARVSAPGRRLDARDEQVLLESWDGKWDDLDVEEDNFFGSPELEHRMLSSSSYVASGGSHAGVTGSGSGSESGSGSRSGSASSGGGPSPIPVPKHAYFDGSLCRAYAPGTLFVGGGGALGIRSVATRSAQPPPALPSGLAQIYCTAGPSHAGTYNVIVTDAHLGSSRRSEPNATFEYAPRIDSTRPQPAVFGTGGGEMEIAGEGLGGWFSLGRAPVVDGCYRAPTLAVDKSSFGNMTVAFCSQLCRGFRFFALAGRFSCSCSNAYSIGALGIGTRVAASNCALPCGGDVAQTCGGNAKLMLWEHCCFPTYQNPGGDDIEILSQTNTTMRVRVPPHSAADAVGMQVTFAGDRPVLPNGCAANTSAVDNFEASSWLHRPLCSQKPTVSVKYDPLLAASVSSVDPTSGSEGTVVKIGGANFAQSGNKVSLQGAPCAILNETSTQITCRAGAASGAASSSSCFELLRADHHLRSGTYTITTKQGKSISVYCDMSTDGGGYTYFPVAAGLKTARHTDANTCQQYGMDLAVPRTARHLKSMYDRYGSSYLTIMPIHNAFSGRRYTSIAMKWSTGGTARDWTSVDRGSWFLRDSPYGEPNGDYTPGCWLQLITSSTPPYKTNDHKCGYSATRYICSTNDKDDAIAPPLVRSSVVVSTQSAGFSTGRTCVTTKGAARTGLAVNDGTKNKRLTASACCSSCRATPRCAAWTWHRPMLAAGGFVPPLPYAQHFNVTGANDTLLDGTYTLSADSYEGQAKYVSSTPNCPNGEPCAIYASAGIWRLGSLAQELYVTNATFSSQPPLHSWAGANGTTLALALVAGPLVTVLDDSTLNSASYSCWLQREAGDQTLSANHFSGVTRVVSFAYQQLFSSISSTSQVGSMTGGAFVNVTGSGFPSSATDPALGWATQAGLRVISSLPGLVQTTTQPQHSASGRKYALISSKRLVFDEAATPLVTSVTPPRGSEGTVLTLSGRRFFAGSLVNLTIHTGPGEDDGSTSSLGAVFIGPSSNRSAVHTLDALPGPNASAWYLLVLPHGMDAVAKIKLTESAGTDGFRLSAATVNNVSVSIGPGGNWLKSSSVELALHSIAPVPVVVPDLRDFAVTVGDTSCEVLSLDQSGANMAPTESSCLSAAVTEFGSKVKASRSALVGGSWGHLPSGCVVQSGGDWAAHFNRKQDSVAVHSTYTIVAMDSAQLTCRLQRPTAGGRHMVLLRTPGGFARGRSSFDINWRIDAITPDAGSAGGGTRVTITGAGFRSTPLPTVTVGSTPCTEVSQVSSSSLVCTTGPSHADKRQVAYGSVRVSVRNAAVGRGSMLIKNSGSAVSARYHQYPHSEGSSLLVNGNAVGLYVGIIDRNQTLGTLTSLRHFWGASQYSELATTLRSLGSDTIVVVASFGAWARYLSPELAGALERCGAPVAVHDHTVTKLGAARDPKLLLVASCGTGATIAGSKFAASGSVPELNIDLNVVGEAALHSNSTIFNFSSILTPTISSVAPAIGSTAGGTTVTISGSGFGTSPNVTIAGVVCAWKLEDVGSYRGKNLCLWGQDSALGVNCTGIGASDTKILCVTNPSPTGAVRFALPVISVAGKGLATVPFLTTFSYVDRWSATTTWGYNSPPKEGDSISIPARNTVLYDLVTSPRLHLLIIEGTLIFDDTADRELNASYIMVRGKGDGSAIGALQIGTPSVPFSHRAVVTLHGNRRSYEIPVYGAKVIGVRFGHLDLHGRARTHSWTRLARTAAAGDTIIELVVAVDWAVGETIVLTPTSRDGVCTPAGCQAENEPGHMEGERRVIVAIGAGGRQLELDRPLQFHHTVRLRGAGLELGDAFRGEVGLLSRNVVVQGDDESYDAQYGCQLLFHSPGQHNSLRVRISNTQIRQTGQGFFIGRYPVHFHLVGNVSESFVLNSTVHDTYNRAIAIHGIHSLRIKHNVVYNTRGHAFFIEDGVETDNRLEYNLGIQTRAVWSLLVVDQTPAIFWVTNPGNHLIGNVAAGSAAYGFWFRPLAHPDGANARTDVCPQMTPLGTFDDNVAHATARHGMKLENLRGHGPAGYSCSGTPVTVVMRRFTSWSNTMNGVWMKGNQNVHLDGFVIAETTKVNFEPWGQGDGVVISNATCIGNFTRDEAASIALGRPVYNSSGAYVQPGEEGGSAIVVENSRMLQHTVALTCCTWAGVGRNAFFTRFRGMKFAGNQFRYQTRDPALGGWSGVHKALWRDEDGSLSGRGPGTLIGASPMLLKDPSCHVEASCMPQGALSWGEAEKGAQAANCTSGLRMLHCKRRFQRVIFAHKFLKQGSHIRFHDTSTGASDKPWITGICQAPIDRWTIAVASGRSYDFDFAESVDDEQEAKLITELQAFELRAGESVVLTQRHMHDCTRFDHNLVQHAGNVGRAIAVDPRPSVFAPNTTVLSTAQFTTSTYKAQIDVPPFTWGGGGWCVDLKARMTSRGAVATQYITKVAQWGESAANGMVKLLHAPRCSEVNCRSEYKHFDGEVRIFAPPALLSCTL